MVLECLLKNKKFLLIIFILLLLAGIYFLLKLRISGDEKIIFCTEEAKLCEDGSYVGRVGPMCEFSDCPIVENTENWKTYVDKENNIEYKLPSEF